MQGGWTGGGERANLLKYKGGVGGRRRREGSRTHGMKQNGVWQKGGEAKEKREGQRGGRSGERGGWDCGGGVGCLFLVG